MTLGEVRRLLEFDTRHETEAFLKQKGALLDYSDAELDRDLQSAQTAARPSSS